MVIASRNPAKAEAARATAAGRTGGRFGRRAWRSTSPTCARCATAATTLAQRHAPLDVVICNAGLWPQRHATSPQGHELAFATNVLGHFALLRELIRAGALARDARVVVLTGDIYILARECTSDYAFRGPWAGCTAYCRSKLGDIWIARELQRRHPELHVAIAHPGVVATSLGGTPSPGFDRIRRRLMLPIERGAETPSSAPPSRSPKGAYIHNTLGEMSSGPTTRAAIARRRSGCGIYARRSATEHPERVSTRPFTVDMHGHVIVPAVEKLVADRPEKRAEPEQMLRAMGAASVEHNARVMMPAIGAKLVNLDARLAAGARPDGHRPAGREPVAQPVLLLGRPRPGARAGAHAERGDRRGVRAPPDAAQGAGQRGAPAPRSSRSSSSTTR